MADTVAPRQDERKAMSLSLIPGLGQFYNGQTLKGIIFLALTALFIFEMFTFGYGALVGFVTLGSVPKQDHSLFLLIRGSLQIIITIIFLAFYGANILDARSIARKINKGEKISKTLKEMIHNIYADGFPYLLIIPSYIFMAFAIVFPVLVTVCTAFINYDFKHTPPAKLLDWVGIENFWNIFNLSTFRDAFMAVFT